MKTRMGSFVLLLAWMLAVVYPVPGFCARVNWGGTDRDQQLGRQLPYDLVYTGAARGGTSTWVSTVTPLTKANIGFSYIKIANGSPGWHELPDGDTGQSITIQLLANPAYQIKEDTPGNMTRTGWDSIYFQAANDWVTLTWIDVSIGWIITGQSKNIVINY